MIENIRQYQKEYLNLLEKNIDLINNSFQLYELVSFIDSVNLFWLERLECIEKELELITRKNYCLLLSGAIYLDYRDYEHYIFRTFGDYHFLNDSILKIENFFRLPPDKIHNPYFHDIFKKAYLDVLNILRHTTDHFYYVPINLIFQKNETNEKEIFESFFWNSISSIFGKEYNEIAGFIKDYKDYESLESSIRPEILQHIVFSNLFDAKRSLRDRVELYLINNKGLDPLFSNTSEPEKFIIALSTYFKQVFEILLISNYFNLTPFIRYDISFYYLLLIMGSNHEEDLNINYLDCVIFYVFHNSLDKSKLKKYSFENYYAMIKKHDYLKLINNKIINNGLVVTEINPNVIIEIIKDTIPLDIFY